MARKKKEELEDAAAATGENTEESVEMKTEGSGETEDSGEASVFDDVLDTVTSAVETVAGAVASGASQLVNAVAGSSDETDKTKTGKRAERVGVVTSDKMTKTVVVRVDRLVKHPIYRKYVRRRKKFMAHDEVGAKIGDKVRIIETRPMSARKRWRVVEIIQKAEL